MQAKFTLLLFCLLHLINSGQVTFKGQIKNGPSPLAGVIVSAGEAFPATSDSAGYFELELPNYSPILSLRLFYTGCSQSRAVNWKPNSLEIIQLTCEGLLNEITLQPLTLADILRLSTENRPLHFNPRSYLLKGFYRNYHYGKYSLCNLIESNTYLLVNANNIPNVYAFAFERPVKAFPHDGKIPIGDDVLDFFLLNPTLSPTGNALNYKVSSDYTYQLIETSEDSVYTILYSSDKYMTDSHGISNYSVAQLNREGVESGIIRISKSDFGLLSFERFCKRNPTFNYPRSNNYVLPERKITQEFVDAHFYVAFEKLEGVYVLREMSHSYTNDFFYANNHHLIERTTECFEWRTDSILEAVPEEIADSFEYEPNTQRWVIPPSSDPMLYGYPNRKYKERQ